MPDEPDVAPRTRAQWRRWLTTHHATSGPVRVILRKKRSDVPGITYEEALEEALCFGWIDSRMDGLDEDRIRQRFSPRKPGGSWSASNKARVERLIAEGRMTEAGAAAIARAKRDGSWTVLDAVEALEVPEDLAAALAADPAAAAGFDASSPSARKQALYRIASAKRPETRARRIEETVRRARDDRRADR